VLVKQKFLDYLVIVLPSFIEKFEIFVEVHIYWGVSPVTHTSLLSVISFAGVFCVSDVIHNTLACNMVLSVITFCSMTDMYQHSAQTHCLHLWGRNKDGGGVLLRYRLHVIVTCRVDCTVL